MKDIKICLECGCLDYRQKEEAHIILSGDITYSFDEVQGHYIINENTYDEDAAEGADWENEGAPECQNCESGDLLDVQLTEEQYRYLIALEDEKRIEVAKAIKEGKFTQAKPRKNAKYIGGGKVLQC